MEKQFHEACLSSFDFIEYLSGTASGYEKAVIEQHLSVCENCFDTFINAFNLHLDHASVPLDGRQSPLGAYQFA
ncbi:MAG: zf-HC2 domain-containing protein [bacterium]